MLGKTHIVSTWGGLEALLLSHHYYYHHYKTLVDQSPLQKVALNYTEKACDFFNFHSGCLQISAQHSLYTFFFFLCFFLCGALGAVFPDIDTPTSMIGRRFNWLYLGNQHRGFTHTLWALLILLGVGVGCYYHKPSLLPFWFAFTFGYALHLIEDSFSRSGVAWTYPFRRYINYNSGAFVKDGYFPKIYYKVGGTFETWFRLFFTGLFIILTFSCLHVLAVKL